jgi:defect-in-organelle-trafficking protein DotC
MIITITMRRKYRLPKTWLGMIWPIKMHSKFFLFLIVLSVIGTGAAFAGPYNYNQDARDEPRNAAMIEGKPSEMKDLQEVQKSDALTGDKKPAKTGDALENSVEQEQDLTLKIRRDSQKEAALSYGARGGLAYRTKLIMDDLKKNEKAMDRVYNFRRLLIKAPSNMFIEPPIVSEALNNLIVSPEGDEAAVADSIYEITRKARIVSAPRNWREYLERTWDTILPPPDILLPETADERKAWRLWVAKGWDEGYSQADEIFQADLDRMTADFEGMVRYRVLLAQNKISQPYATMVDRGVTGVESETSVGGKPMKITNEMRVGDRAIRITQPVTLRPDNSDANWEPPMQTNP